MIGTAVCWPSVFWTLVEALEEGQGGIVDDELQCTTTVIAASPLLVELSQSSMSIHC